MFNFIQKLGTKFTKKASNYFKLRIGYTLFSAMPCSQFQKLPTFFTKHVFRYDCDVCSPQHLLLEHYSFTLFQWMAICQWQAGPEKAKHGEQLTEKIYTYNILETWQSLFMDGISTVLHTTLRRVSLWYVYFMVHWLQ